MRYKKFLSVLCLIGFVPLFVSAKVPKGFWEAVEKGNLEQVEAFIKEDPKLVNIRRKNGLAPLHYAAEAGDLSLLKFLVAKGADVKKENLYGIAPIVDAASNGHLEVVKFLLERGASCKDSRILPRTIGNHHQNVVEFLVKNGADPNDGLIIAIEIEDTQMVKFLIKEGADVNKQYKAFYVSSALDAAIQKNSFSMVTLLIENGAHPQLTEVDSAVEKGYTEMATLLKKEMVFEDPLFSAIKEGNVDKVKDLVNKNPSCVNSEPLSGFTPLMIAVRFGNRETVEFLVKKGADLTKKRKDLTLLMYAAIYNRLDMVKFLVEQGAKVNTEAKAISSCTNYTALMFASNLGHLDVVKFLVQHGANVNQATSVGTTVLDGAIKYNHLDVVKFLVGNGAKVNVEWGEKPLMAAAYRGSLDIIKFLVEKNAHIDLPTIDETFKEGVAYPAVVDFLLKEISFKDPLLKAIQNQDVGKIRSLIKKNPKIMNSAPLPLMVAVRFGNPEVVKILVDNGAHVNKKSKGRTPLEVAAMYDRLDVVKLLAKHSPSIVDQNNSELEALTCAVELGYLKMVEFLIGNETNLGKAISSSPEHKVNIGATLLKIALYRDKLEIFKLLVNKGFSSPPQTKSYLKAYDLSFYHPRIKEFLESLPD